MWKLSITPLGTKKSVVTNQMGRKRTCLNKTVLNANPKGRQDNVKRGDIQQDELTKHSTGLLAENEVVVENSKTSKSKLSVYVRFYFDTPLKLMVGVREGIPSL